MTEEEYDAQMDAVAWYLTECNLADYARKELRETAKNPGLTVNGGAKTVLIPLFITTEQMRMMYDDV